MAQLEKYLGKYSFGVDGFSFVLALSDQQIITTQKHNASQLEVVQQMDKFDKYSVLFAKTLVAYLSEEKHNFSLMFPVLIFKNASLTNLTGISDILQILHEKTQAVMVQLGIVSQNSLYDVLYASLKKPDNPDFNKKAKEASDLNTSLYTKVCLIHDIAGNLCFNPKLRPIEFEFGITERYQQLLNTITNFSQTPGVKLVYLSLLWHQSNLTCFIPILTDQEPFWETNYNQPCIQDVDQVRDPEVVGETNLLDKIFLSQIIQQSKCYFSSSPYPISEIDDTRLYIMDPNKTIDDYYLKQDVAQFIAYSQNSVLATLMHRSFFERPKRVLSLITLNQTPVEAQFLINAGIGLCIGAAIGGCGVRKLYNIQQVQIPYLIFRALNDLGLIYPIEYNKQTQFELIQLAVAALKKKDMTISQKKQREDVGLAVPVQKVTVEQTQENVFREEQKVVRAASPMRCMESRLDDEDLVKQLSPTRVFSIRKKLPQVLRKQDDVQQQIDQLEEKVIKARTELKLRQCQINDIQRQQMILEQVQNVKVTLVEQLMFEQTKMQRIQEKLEIQSKKLQRLNQDILNGKKLNIRWQWEIDAIDQ